MRALRRRWVYGLTAGIAALVVVPPGAGAKHPQPPPDISKVDYSPIGAYKPGDKVPSPLDFVGERNGRPLTFNPSEKYNAFDTNVFETLALPYRAAGDRSVNDPYGNGGDPRHGFCDDDPDPDLDTDRRGDLAPLAGECPNHQLEYSQYFEATMREILRDFGVSVRRYRFRNPGSGNTQPGTAINTAAIVPGADHPDERVIVSGHYDQTDDGPASAWDSAEGHAQVIRIAKIMADYWRATGTRPSATVIFVPWDAEESGTLGSLDYVRNTLPPGHASKVRGYFNTDPCAGGYPAYRNGLFPNRINMGIQVANPDRVDDLLTFETGNPPEDARDRMKVFNDRANTWLDEVLTKLDDTLEIAPDQRREIFVSDTEAGADSTGATRSDIGNGISIDDSRDILFSSDWANFEDVGVPFLNPGPAITGPSTQGDPNTPEAVFVLHSPFDNIETVNALSSLDATGKTFSEGWIKGMELCAQLLAWPMLQNEQGGGQAANGEVVAYYEALPNEAHLNEPVVFDADGTYQYASASGRTFVAESHLEYDWRFGDGTRATGKRVEHAFAAPGVYKTRLTVKGASRPGGSSKDTMTLHVHVRDATAPQLTGPRLHPLAAVDDDGAYTLTWDAPFEEEGLQGFSVEESTNLTALLTDEAEVAPAASESRWTAAHNDATNRLQGWQPSDSATVKLRGNQRHSGERSFWTGVSPNDFAAPPGDVKSTLTLKDPIDVGERGLELSYWSLFQNEGDDQGRVEVAVVSDDPSAQLEWQPVDEIRATFTGATDPHDPAICSTRDPETLSDEFERRRVPLGDYEGKRILVRFVYALGPDNRLLSHPCGWYVDDILLRGGTFTEIGTTAASERQFSVSGRGPGNYAHRIRALYPGERRSAGGTIETTTVVAGGG